jgi:formate--tetrahydrofolate ligase
LPKGWELPIGDSPCYKRAGLLVPVAGVIKLVRGIGAAPAFRRVDVDIKTGKVKGLG